jgi:hypothetical protein
MMIRFYNKKIKKCSPAVEFNLTFGLEWKECEAIMEKLGFKLEVNALEIA